ncbi:MAG: hypothetical protein ABI382_12175 [Nakamurella sp.]
MARFKFSGSGSAAGAEGASLEDSAGVSEEDSAGAEDSTGASLEDSAGADELDAAELSDEEAAVGFCVEAPQEATIPATANAAITVVTREIRNIRSCLSADTITFRNPHTIPARGYRPVPSQQHV